MPNILTVPAREGFLSVPSVEPAAKPPEDYQNIHSDPSEFGAQVGGGLEKLGEGALKASDFYSQAASEQAYTQLQREYSNIMSGDPNTPGDMGYLGLSGQDAMNARGDVTAKMDAALQRIQGGLYTGKSQLDFEQRSRRLQAYNLDQVGRHYESQSHVWGASVQSGAMVEDQRRAGNIYNDDEGLKHIIADQDVLGTRLSQHTGKDPLSTAAEAKSKVIGAAIDGAIAHNDFGRAQHLVDTFGDMVDPTARAAFATHLRSQNTAAEGNALLQRAQSGDVGTPAASHATGPSGELSDPRGKVPVIRAAAIKNDIDPDVMVRVAQSEGLGTFLGDGGASGGAMQLHTTPGGAGGHVGDLFRQQTGKDPLDPKNEDATIEFAAEHAAKNGWGDWNGAKASGITGMMGIGGRGGAPAPLVPTGANGTSGAGGVEVWGDSLGVGLQGQLKSGGRVHGGDSPTTILNNIKAQPENYWQGKTVVLPSGSNNGVDGPEMPVVEDTIKYLKDHHANVIAVGYGPKFPEKNAALAEIAGRQQVPVVAAEGVGATEGVHPSPGGYGTMAQKIRDLATKPALPAPDQMQGQPAPPAGVRPMGNGPAMPPGIPAPGVAEIAQLQAAETESYAHTLDNLDRLSANASPQAIQHASSQAQLQHNRKEAVLAGQMKALIEARNVALDGYVKELRPDAPIAPDLYDRITADIHIDATSRENLYKLVETHAKKSVAGDLHDYGPKFYEAYNRLSLDNDNPQRLRGAADILPLAAPKDDGSQDITLAGVGKLIQSANELQKRDPILAEKKKELLGLIMPINRTAEDDPSTYGLALRQQRYGLNWDIDQQIAQAEKDKKNPYNLFNPTSPDYLGKHYQEQIDANALKQKIEGDQAYKTEAGIVAAVKAGKLTRQQAAERLRAIGVPFVDPSASGAAPPAQAPLR